MPDRRFSLPPVPPPSATVVAAMEAMLATEGPCHVAGRYIRDGALCATARRQEAERRVAAAEREARWLAAHRCAWCGRPVAPGTPYAVLAGEPLHARPCLIEFDVVVYGGRDERDACRFAPVHQEAA